MPLSVASDLCLHCLPMSHKNGAMLIKGYATYLRRLSSCHFRQITVNIDHWLLRWLKFLIQVHKVKFSKSPIKWLLNEGRK